MITFRNQDDVIVELADSGRFSTLIGRDLTRPVSAATVPNLVIFSYQFSGV